MPDYSPPYITRSCDARVGTPDLIVIKRALRAGLEATLKNPFGLSGSLNTRENAEPVLRGVRFQA